MITQAKLLAAAKKIVDAAKAKKNPAKRKGTAKAKRVSQVTKKAPSKRLVARRKANTEKGYFPNPIEIERAHALPFHVYTVKTGKGPLTGKPVAKPVKLLASFATESLAKDFAKKQFTTVGVFKD